MYHTIYTVFVFLQRLHLFYVGIFGHSRHFFLYSASVEIQLSAKLTKQDRLFGNYHYENMLSQKDQIVFLLTVLKFIDETINRRFFALYLKLDNIIHQWDQWQLNPTKNKRNFPKQIAFHWISISLLNLINILRRMNDCENS